MASSGKTVDGTDGSDFTHRERVVSQYHTSAKTKSNLSNCLYLHLLVAFVLLVKLSPAILDYLDIFILQLEEQNIPKPLLWEWIWFGGTFLLFLIGANAIKASKVGKIQIFCALVFLLGILPILYVMVINYSDAYAFLFDRQSKIYKTWKGLPLAILWYIFSVIALNIHGCELYYGLVLKDAWNIKRKKA